MLISTVLGSILHSIPLFLSMLFCWWKKQKHILLEKVFLFLFTIHMGEWMREKRSAEIFSCSNSLFCLLLFKNLYRIHLGKFHKDRSISCRRNKLKDNKISVLKDSCQLQPNSDLFSPNIPDHKSWLFSKRKKKLLVFLLVPMQAQQKALV